MITLSLFKADLGSAVGHHKPPKEILSMAKEGLEKLRKRKKIIDFLVFNAGDDLQVLLSHKKGKRNESLYKEIWNLFLYITKEFSIPSKLYGAGQDLIAKKYTKGLEGTGIGIAEMSFKERKTEPVLVFGADKTEPSAFNIFLYKIFADPFNTPGLVISLIMRRGFEFIVVDLEKHKKASLKAPEEIYELLSLLGSTSQYAVREVYRRADKEIAMVGTITKLSGVAGKYIGKDDPSMLIRVGKGFPSVGEVLEAFSFPYLVNGWMRGSHYGPLIPVSLKDSRVSRFDGPPRIVCIGVQLKNGEITYPTDMFEDVAFDRVREKALEYADLIRRQGPFQPHRGTLEEMRYTSLKEVINSLKKKWKKLD